jgi:hypothetical protein
VANDWVDAVWVSVSDARQAEALRLEAVRRQLMAREARWSSLGRRCYNPSPLIKNYTFEPAPVTLNRP